MIIHAGEMSIKCLVLGELMTNCYVLSCGSTGVSPVSAWIVDPGLSPAPLLEYLERAALSPERILLTHGHGDHIAGAAAVKQAYPAAVLTVPQADAEMLSDPAANMSAAFGFHITAPPAEKTVQAGAKLVEKGGTGAGFYLILEGKAEVIANGEKLAEFGAGDFFGELAVIDGAPRTADVVALTDTTCIVVSQWAMRSIISSHAEIALSMLEELARRLRATDEARASVD